MRAILPFLAAAIVFSSCYSNPAGSAPAVQSLQPGSEVHRRWLDERLAVDGWTSSATRLQARRISGATVGPQPRAGCIVTVNYVGRLADGLIFDDTWARHEPYEFVFVRTIAGWREALQMMRPGETWEFIMPPELGYGDRGYRAETPQERSIPPGATLHFLIQLVSIKNCT